MPIVNVGSFCGILLSPTSPASGYYFTNKTLISAKTLVLSVSSSVLRVENFTDGGFNLPATDSDYKIKFGWYDEITAPSVSTTGINVGIGDSRLRYLYTGTAPTSNFSIYPVVYMTNSFDSSTISGISFQILSPVTITGATTSPSRIIGATNSLTFNQETSLPSVISVISYFVNSTYMSAGQPKPILTSNGEELDVNRPLVNTSGLARFSMTGTYSSSGISTYAVTPAISGATATVTTSSYQITVGSNNYKPTLLITADPESVSISEIRTIVINTIPANSGILSWLPASTPSPDTYTIGTYVNYFAAVRDQRPERGYFNILPIGLGDANTNVNVFLLAPSDNGAIFYLAATGMKSAKIPFASGSLGSLDGTNTLENIGVWSFDYDSTASPSVGSAFRLKYTKRNDAGTFDIYYLKNRMQSTTIKTDGTQFTCTICTLSSGACRSIITESTAVPAPILGTYISDTLSITFQTKDNSPSVAHSVSGTGYRGTNPLNYTFRYYVLKNLPGVVKVLDQSNMQVDFAFYSNNVRDKVTNVSYIKV